MKLWIFTICTTLLFASTAIAETTIKKNIHHHLFFNFSTTIVVIKGEIDVEDKPVFKLFKDKKLVVEQELEKLPFRYKIKHQGNEGKYALQVLVNNMIEENGNFTLE